LNQHRPRQELRTMCKPSKIIAPPSPTSVLDVANKSLLLNAVFDKNDNHAPSAAAKWSCVGILVAFMAVWCKFTFVPENDPTNNMHGYQIPLVMTTIYLISLPLLKRFSDVVFRDIDVKSLLLPSMVVYNVSQVILNAWMVYRFIRAVSVEGHPFIGNTSSPLCSFVVWVHYCDKYLEFFDTYFMVMRGRMDQVSFLHVYHHFTISWAWWIGVTFFPDGDAYFGALLNSFIHVLMYSYYSLSLLKISCPWKKYLTMLQLIQFTSVIVYSFFAIWLYAEEFETKHHIAIGTQLFEMSTLFVLFYYFYQKSYSTKRKDKTLATLSKEQ